MNGSCNSCGHIGGIYAEVDESTDEVMPYCPVCMSENVDLDTPINGQTFRRYEELPKTRGDDDE